MIITLTESNKDTLIGKYAKCFKYIEPDSGDICYTLDEPFYNSEIEYKLVQDVDHYMSSNVNIFSLYLDEYASLEVFADEEIEIFDTNMYQNLLI